MDSEAMGPARHNVIDSSTPDLCSFRLRLPQLSTDSTSGRVFPADVLFAWTGGGTEAKTTKTSRTCAMTVSLQFHVDAFACQLRGPFPAWRAQLGAQEL